MSYLLWNQSAIILPSRHTLQQDSVFQNLQTFSFFRTFFHLFIISSSCCTGVVDPIFLEFFTSLLPNKLWQNVALILATSTRYLLAPGTLTIDTL